MLSPARPQPGEPDYETRLRRYEQEREAKRRHPENWGYVQPQSPTKTHPARNNTAPESRNNTAPLASSPTVITVQPAPGSVRQGDHGSHRKSRHRR